MDIEAGRTTTKRFRAKGHGSNGSAPRTNMTDAATFEELVEAFYAARSAPVTIHDPDPKLAFDHVEAAFEHAHGTIEHRWFASRHQAGVVLTKDGALYVTPPEEGGQVAALCFTALAIAAEARRNGFVDDRVACGALLYIAVVSLLQIVDAKQTVNDATCKAVSLQFEKARQTFLERRQRRARMFYSAGVVVGTFGIFLISLATFWILPKLVSHLVDAGQLEHVVEMFTACINAGGAGALLSVMTRMSSGSLRIRDEESRMVLFLTGGFRPVIGGISGVAVYALYKAQLLPLQLPPAGSEFFTFGGLAFLAGFSERLAQDALMQTDRKAFGTPAKSG